MKWALSFSLSIFTIICFLSIEMKTKIKEINKNWKQIFDSDTPQQN